MSQPTMNMYPNSSTNGLPQTLYTNDSNMQIFHNFSTTHFNNNDIMQLKGKNLIPIIAQLFKSPSLNFHQQGKITNANMNFYSFNGKLPRKSRKISNEKDKKGPKYGQKFTPEEDEKLRNLVQTIGSQKWDLIAKEMPGRNGRQCRDRYMNYLIPGYFTGQWSKEEDSILRQKYYELGPQWSKIADFLKNRSSNAVKNRWNYFVSKHLEEEYEEILNIPDRTNKEHNETIAPVENKYKKEITQDSFEINPFCDFFDTENNDFNIDDDYFEFDFLEDN